MLLKKVCYLAHNSVLLLSMLSKKVCYLADNSGLLKHTFMCASQPNSHSFIVSTIYHPPSATVESFSQIESLLKNVDDKSKEIYLLGYLNCNLLDQSNSSAKHLHSIMQLYQLTQVIDKPTRITESSSTLLDVCSITPCPKGIAFCDVIHMGVSDHSLIYVVRKINSYLKPHASKKVEFQSFKHFNVENFKIDLINYCGI